MPQRETDAYILGTERAELYRLGLQHQVWAEEARRGWRSAGFTAGQTLLDLGCGPGFCTQDLAYMVGERGRVIGVDLSTGFIDFATQVNRLHELPVEFVASSFDDMTLAPDSLDGGYCRWALAWVPNPAEIIAKVVAALRPGAAFVCHEYFDWSTLQTEPHRPELAASIAAALKSFKDSEGDIDIGRRLPGLFVEQGLEIAGVRAMSKLALPGTLTWQWPSSFFAIYLPKLVEAGLLDEQTCSDALIQWQQLETTPGACFYGPQMVEVIGVKP
jgi:SAM-dependent methyltransferase